MKGQDVNSKWKRLAIALDFALSNRVVDFHLCPATINHNRTTNKLFWPTKLPLTKNPTETELQCMKYVIRKPYNIVSTGRSLGFEQTRCLCSIGQFPPVTIFEALSLVGFRPCKFIVGAQLNTTTQSPLNVHQVLNKPVVYVRLVNSLK